MLAVSPINRAAELGPSRFPWWKDWRGECVALIASGPSAKKADIELLRNRIHVAVVKDNIELCPFADLVYSCDFSWWRHVRGLPKYQGLKIAYEAQARDHYREIVKIEIKDKLLDRLLLDEPGVMGSGGNSGFQLANLVAQFGVSGIILIGFDMHGRGGEHWFGRNNGMGMSNPSESNYVRWRKAFDVAAPELTKLGVDVVNVSPPSALTCFRRDTIENTLAGWGL